MRVHEATTPADSRRFIQFPRTLYRSDPCWAPPLWMDERGAYTGKSNAILARSDYALLLAEADGRVVGRSLVYVDHAFNDYYKTRTGFFGAFECVKDLAVAQALDERAVSWLAARGMNRVRGPIHPVSESWGFLLSGFDTPPVFMASYNPPWYNDFMVQLGYAKAKDLLAYDASNEKSYKIPGRFANFSARMLGAHEGLSVRPLSMKRLVQDADAILEISNAALKDNWGFVPVNRNEFQDMFRKLKPIADPNAIWFVEDKGRPVGFALGFPDLNIILKKIGGRMLPFGFLHLLFGVKKVKDYRLFGLAVLPEYQGKGLDVLLYMELFKALAPRIQRLEANYILEDNLKIKNALEKLELDLVKTYRVYEKAI
ncbi:MAG: GNAT family N-acetyltransferase [Spirochaetia bacterium]